MLLKANEFQQACKKILEAVDTSSEVSDMLELKATAGCLYLMVTNNEYFVKVKLNVDSDESFIAIVSARLFLSLISKITTEEIELSIRNNFLIIKANGEYKLPMPNINDTTELSEIKIMNVVKQFKISSDILSSIVLYNSKELNIDTFSIKIPAQKMFYIDQEGCITFTTGACVNTFSLAEPLKILLPLKIVKLFKLFNNEEVSFTLGYDLTSSSISYTKVKFESSNISISAIIVSTKSLVDSVPVDAIRERANTNYPYTININKDLLLQALNRLLLFTTDNANTRGYGTLVFETQSFTLYDINMVNSESLNYSGTILPEDLHYKISLNLINLKTTLENCEDKFISLSFGDEISIVISRGNIKNILPQLVVTE